MRTFLLMLFTLAAACDAPASANPAPRCSAAGTCEAGRMCHAGFCIRLPAADAGRAPDARDASVAPAAPEDAAVSAQDAGVSAPPAAPDASSDGVDAGGGDGDEDEEDEDEDGMQSEPPCEGLLCCKLGEIMCDGACVNPAKDRDHCGGCDVSCRRGPCKLGICTHQ